MSKHISTSSLDAFGGEGSFGAIPFHVKVAIYGSLPGTKIKY